MNKLFAVLIVIFVSACSPYTTEKSILTTSPSYTLTTTETLTQSPTFTRTLMPTLTALPTATPTINQTLLPATTFFGGGGGLIAFTSVDPKYPSPHHIYLMDIEGIHITQITNGEYAEKNPSWSPDGKRIAFSFADGGSTTLYVIEVDGSGMMMLIDKPVQDWKPAWSPDGKNIAFVSLRSDPAPWTCKYDCNSEIYIMNSDGSNITRLTNNLAYDDSPSWSPDSTHIAFMSSRDGNDEIFIMKSDGSNIIQLTYNPAEESQPSWSPDGKHIAFVSDRSGQRDIYLMESDGSKVKRLTYSVGTNEEPAWSPDGTRIVFVSSRDESNPATCNYYTCNYEIYVMNSDGSNVIRLTYTPGIESHPAWQP